MTRASDLPSTSVVSRSLLARFATDRPLQRIAIGVVLGAIGVIFTLSYAALLFAGPLKEHIAAGMGMMLFSGAVLAIVTAFFTSYGPIYSQVREVTIAYLALVGPVVAAAVGSGPEVLPTVVAMVAVASIALGAVFFATGQLGLSRFIRYIPFPVMSGFLAAVAWLIVTGALAIITGEPFELGSLGELTEPDVLPRLACAVGFMAIALLLGRIIRSGLILPLLVVVAVIAFSAIVAIAGIPSEELQQSGWTIALPEGEALWPPIEPADLGAVDWGAILGQVPAMSVIIPVAMIAVLLNISGLEVEAKRDIDLDNEMRTAGIGNIVAGLGGGAPGYQSLSMTHLSVALGGASRLTTLVAGLVLVVVLFVGRPIAGLIPLPIFAGVILATGATLLAQRLIGSYRRLQTGEYLIVLGIFVLTVWLGFLAAVLFGTVAAMALFVFDYSRTSVVKLELTGREYQSSAMSSDARRRLLQEYGDAILIMRLQGFLFFGTANVLRRSIEQRLSAASGKDTIRFLLLDFHLVSGLDSAAVESFSRLAETGRQYGVEIILAQVTPDVARTLSKSGLVLGGAAPVRIIKDIDTGLAECEFKILSGIDPELAEARPRPIARQIEQYVGSDADAETLARFLDRVELADQDVLVLQDSPSDELYFIESGIASVRLRTETGDVRLATLGPGAIAGEISFYTGKKRTATVVAEGALIAWRFSRHSLDRLQHSDPELASLFHQAMAAMLAERLTATNRLVRFLAQ